MPVPPLPDSVHFDFYQCFLRAMSATNDQLKPHGHTQLSPTRRLRLAIDETAHQTGMSPAYVCKQLVVLGLRAPRKVFPPAFVSFVQQQRNQMPLPIKGFDQADQSIKDLCAYWQDLDNKMESDTGAQGETLEKQSL